MAEKEILTKAIALGMIFADKIFREEGTRKVHIAGMFGAIYGIEFPTMHGPLYIYQRFTDVTGPKEQTGCLEVQYLDGEHEKVMELSTPVINQDRLGATEIIFGISRLPLLRPGKMEFRFSLNNSCLNTGTLDIIKPEQGEQGE